MTAMKMAANKNACRIPYSERLRDIELLRGERNSGHRHGLPREPGHAFLHEIDLHDADARLRGHRHLRVHHDGLARCDQNPELRVRAIAYAIAGGSRTL